MEPLEHRQFDAETLVVEHPPRWGHPSKRAIYELHCHAGGPHAGTIEYARWPEPPLPDTSTTPLRVTFRPGVFDYASVGDAVVWHMNFADPHLFVAYDSALMAQDELQVAEHPALGSVREALRADHILPMTVGMDGRATPVTVSGVQRRCSIDTAPNADAGRPRGLYGNAFSIAPLGQVLAATTPLVPPSISNILAIAAPGGGVGAYTVEEIRHVAATAYAGFSAAHDAGGRIGPGLRTEIHTGFWGCGAFGGNRTLMTLLQFLAAELAGVDLVFWTVTELDLPIAKDACALYRQLRAGASQTDAFIESVAGLELEWGMPDGN
jgi:hypothetical protein